MEWAGAPVMMDRATTYTACSMASTTLDAGMSVTCVEVVRSLTTHRPRKCSKAALNGALLTSRHRSGSARSARRLRVRE